MTLRPQTGCIILWCKFDSYEGVLSGLSGYLVEEQVSNYSDINEKFLLDECCFAFLLRFLPIKFLVTDHKEQKFSVNSIIGIW